MRSAKPRTRGVCRSGLINYKECYMKKLITMFLAVVISVGSVFISGCANETVKVDETKSQLYVQNCANGYGSEWLNQTIAAFEDWAKDKHFAEGKTGVQVHSENNSDSGASLLNKMADAAIQVYFSEEAYYYNFVSKKLVKNINEEVTKPLTEFGESRSILDKLKAASGTQYTESLTGTDGNYYGLPWWAGIRGFNYDVDLFDDNNLFIAKGGCPSEYNRTNKNCDAALTGKFSEYKWTNYDGERSAGPDGKYGTYDDGLPATYNEFFALCDRMVDEGIVPLIWTGEHQYIDHASRNLHADYEGADNYEHILSLSGNVKDIVDLESVKGNLDGTVDFDSVKYLGGENGVDITYDNGYLMQRQVGKLYALDFAKRLMSHTEYYDERRCTSATFSHLDAQSYYLYSKYDSDKTPIGIIYDGSWWMNEASDTFDTMQEAAYEKSGRYERRLGFMPYPKATDEKVGETSVVVSQSDAYCFINNNIKDEETLAVAKSFYRFCHTDQALKIFNGVTGGIRPFDFEYEKEEYDKLDNYAKSTYHILSNFDVIYPLRYNELFIMNQSYFTARYIDFYSTVNNSYRAYKTLKDNVTVKEYFEGIADYYSESYYRNQFYYYFNK